MQTTLGADSVKLKSPENHAEVAILRVSTISRCGWSICCRMKRYAHDHFHETMGDANFSGLITGSGVFGWDIIFDNIPLGASEHAWIAESG